MITKPNASGPATKPSAIFHTPTESGTHLTRFRAHRPLWTRCTRVRHVQVPDRVTVAQAFYRFAAARERICAKTANGGKPRLSRDCGTPFAVPGRGGFPALVPGGSILVGVKQGIHRLGDLQPGKPREPMRKRLPNLFSRRGRSYTKIPA